MKTFDTALRDLARAIRRLEGTEERKIARRNARRAALKELRHVRALLDEKAPAIVERREVKRRGPGSRIKTLQREGWIAVDAAEAGQFAAAGVRVRRVAWKTQTETARPATYINGHGWKAQPPVVTTSKEESLFVPRWAIAIGPGNPTKLRAAKKDPLLRKSVAADKLLRDSAA